MRVHHVHSIVTADEKNFYEAVNTFKTADVEYIDAISVIRGKKNHWTFFFDGENAIKLRKYLYSIGDMESTD